ncbi:glycosyltransferase family 4 protein [Argonema antarcticum]|uniref:glycosyltransferase family 4 protein n=1 Tax=Argonema antarcticum TaxID=2942763 RepID=UPI00201312C7|nr:glycosyltransferase family 4 protein [Argonema antarcticum]MCL1471487.1 glycosyltransferase family 4 protein [Argonema antarcticum A004/B2]
MINLSYVTTYDVLNSSTWLKHQVGLYGAGYYISQTLQNQSVSMDYIGPLKKNFAPITRTKWSFYRYLQKKDYYSWADKLTLKDYAYQVSQKLSKLNSDVVLCPENAVPIAYLNCQQPIVLWTDTTLAALINFYPYLSNLCEETKKNIYTLEKSALDRCKLVIYSSDWAAETAIQIYGIDPNKVRVVPWGANIECDRTLNDIQNIVQSRPLNPCKLLFFGAQWERKGGDIALAVAKELTSRGLITELTVIGCDSSVTNETIPKFVKFLGFIDKSTKEGEHKINQLLAESHFLILPSRAETYGHVFCEANSFGVPCLATKIGGVPTIIKDNLNGKIFALDAPISEYCTYINNYITNYKEYKRLALSSFNEYQYRLNWSVAGQSIKQLLGDLVK